MVAMRALVALLSLSLSMVAALPQDAAAYNMTAPVSAEKNKAVDLADDDWNVSASDGSVTVDFYSDQNPDHSTVIDANTCEGKAEIALMKWRELCKRWSAVFHGRCYSHAPSRDTCCPVPHGDSCTEFWPRIGE